MNCEYFAISFKNILTLSFPIGWDELGVIATGLAVIVAVLANMNATKQLKSALEMQEQSKNVGLLDRRIKLAEQIKSGKDVLELELRILFNNDIVEHYTALQKHIKAKKDAEFDLETFYRINEDIGAVDIRSAFEEFEVYMDNPNCPEETVHKYEEYCQKTTVFDGLGSYGPDTTCYNYSEINKRIVTEGNSADEKLKLTIQLMEKFIADSIKPLDKKQKINFFIFKKGSSQNGDD